MASASTSTTASPSSSAQQKESWQRCSITAELLEDAHLGSGTGGPGVHALLARDRAGNPVIWASHLEGLLRAKAREVFEESTVTRMFGGPGGNQQPLLFTSLYCDGPVVCRIWTSTARESHLNRAPAGDTLRAVEYLAKNTKLTGSVELPSSELLHLERLLLLLESVGHGRATGAGKIRFSLDLAPPRRRELKLQENAAGIRLLLCNRDPLCVAATANPGNLIPTEPFIPGRTLLGALAKWLLDEGDRDTAALLVSERISVSDALPLPELEWPENTMTSTAEQLSSIEALPAPLPIRSPKPRGRAGESPWWSEAAAPASWMPPPIEKEGAPSREKTKRAPEDLYLMRLGDAAWRAYRPEVRVRLRNGRPNPEQPDPLLFATEQLAERTHFLADLRGTPAEMRTLIQALRPVFEARRWIRIGRSGAPVEVALVAALPAERKPSLGPCFLTLTSDLLARDMFLRWRTSLEEEHFSSVPGWPTEVITVEPVEQADTKIHGFNGTARLWRMPAAAVRRGSVFRVSGPGVASLARAAAEGKWLGERTHEGFGRFRLDHELPSIPEPASRPRQSAVLGDAADEAICRVTQQWLTEFSELGDPRASKPRLPGLSQWMDLVHDLRGAQASSAISSRLQPKTMGAARWDEAPAKAVLLKLQQISTRDREAYAAMFVRWLRIAMKKARRGAHEQRRQT